MDKNAIKKYAVWARTELIDRVRQRAVRYEVTADANPNADSASGKVLTQIEKTQRQAAIARMRDKGYEYVIEEVAYTWFNRFAALRYMEVNNYLPSRVRVFTDENGSFKPQILTEAIHLNLDGLDMEKVYALKEAEDNDELYKYLLITQCNALSAVLPQMFKPVDEKCKKEENDYTILLFPDNLLREGSVVEQMVGMISEDNWLDAVQIIGWLYQYYNSEPKDKVFADLKKNIKITKENIPAATQLFTPDWIVRYMVENSLGRLWLEGHPQNADILLPTEEEQDAYIAGDRNSEDSKWHYYLKEAEQEPEVQAQLAEIRKEYAALKPENILCIDPCMGSGHIIVYMFDALMKIYAAYGYSTRESVQSIIENNLYGLDIDDRAAQLAYFAVMMKAVQYDNRFLKRDPATIPQPHVYSIKESNHLDSDAVEYFCNGDKKLTDAMHTLIDEMHDASEYGSILNVTQVDFAALYARFEDINDDISMYREVALNELLPLVQVAETLAQKYGVVVTNPPYMEISSGSKKLVDYVNDHYIGGKTDMFAVFIERAALYANSTGFVGMITQPSLTSLVSFEKLRKKLFIEKSFYTLAHMGRGIFGIDFGSVAFVYRNCHIKNCAAKYFKLYERTFQFLQANDIRDIYLQAKNNPNYKFDFEAYDTSNAISNVSCDSGNQIAFTAHQDKFMLVPGVPFAYTMTEKMIDAYSAGLLGDSFITREGMATAGNDEYLRMWFEVSVDNIGFNCRDAKSSVDSKKRWFPYNKGGDYRKWYGNNDYVVDWENDGIRIRNNKDSKTGRIRSHNYNGEYSFRRGLTWSSISSGDISIRWSEEGFLFDSKGAKGFAGSEDEMYSILAFLNSSTAMRYLKVISPTMDFKVGDIIQLPLNRSIFHNKELQELVKRGISLMKSEWDSKETSWDYSGFPISGQGVLANDVHKYVESKASAKEKLRTIEEQINHIIAQIYGLDSDTKCEVSDDKLSITDCTITSAVKELISYAVGCMFGRYSLHKKGLDYAGGVWEKEENSNFIPDNDNIIPICDDEYFEDDIVGIFIKFLRAAYGEDNLEENLKFIAGALPGKGQPRNIIRKYFLNDFFTDHCNMYSITGSGKRPIYWLFESGKKGGFKALIYMHRYQPDTIARMRTDYVHEQQSRYRTAIADLENRIAGASTSERVRLTKQLSKLQDQSEELHTYEEKIHHLADRMIAIDLDDGVKHNYEIFKDVLAKIK